MSVVLVIRDQQCYLDLPQTIIHRLVRHLSSLLSLLTKGLVKPIKRVLTFSVSSGLMFYKLMYFGLIWICNILGVCKWTQVNTALQTDIMIILGTLFMCFIAGWGSDCCALWLRVSCFRFSKKKLLCSAEYKLYNSELEYGCSKTKLHTMSVISWVWRELLW